MLTWEIKAQNQGNCVCKNSLEKVYRKGFHNWLQVYVNPCWSTFWCRIWNFINLRRKLISFLKLSSTSLDLCALVLFPVILWLFQLKRQFCLRKIQVKFPEWNLQGLKHKRLQPFWKFPHPRNLKNIRYTWNNLLINAYRVKHLSTFDFFVYPTSSLHKWNQFLQVN